MSATNFADHRVVASCDGMPAMRFFTVKKIFPTSKRLFA